TRVAPDGVSAGATFDVVVGASPRDQIGPPPAARVVGPRPALDPGVPPAAVAGAGPPVARVVPPATHDPTVPAEPDDRVVPVATADHVPAGGAPKDVVAVRARDRAPGRAGAPEWPSGDRARNDHRCEDADDDDRATGTVTRGCRRPPPSRGL